MEYVVSGFCESMNYFKPMHLTFAWKKKNIATGVKLTLTSFILFWKGGRQARCPH